MILKNAKIYVAGHKGLVGSALVRKLQADGYSNLILRAHSELELMNQSEYVFLAAAKVGGIYANNTYRGEFIYENLMVQCNVIEAARQHKVKRLLFLGSSCIYPRDCPQPMREEYLLTGILEKTNEPYAVAKIAGIKLCEAYNDQYNTDFVSVMPTNLYGQNDNFDLESSHVLPALLRKIHEAKVNKAPAVTIWGSGTPKREFLHVDDMASACLFLMNESHPHKMVNIGSGQEVSIRELAELMCDVVGFESNIEYDTNKPDGTPRKLLDCTKLTQLGWTSQISLREGIQKTYQWCLRNKSF
jgi:GDP-L-fucose synthase